MQRQQKPIDWIFFQSIILVVGLTVDTLNSSVLFTPILGFISFTIYIGLNWNGFIEKKIWGGIPNLVTTMRLLLLFLAPFLKDTFSLAILTTIVVSLDGIDGFLARKLNQVTLFGGKIDMETDAFFCLLFSVIITKNHPELSWIIISGSLRYCYKIVTTICSKSNFIETKKAYARYIAGCYFVSFILFFLLDYSIGKYLIIIGNILVISSFTVSFYEFFKFKKST